MTSADVSDELIESLNYLGGDAPVEPSSSPAKFAFALDFDSSVVWPDLPFDTASPASRYPPDARPLILRTLDSVAVMFRDAVPRAWDFVNQHMDTAMIRQSPAVDGASSSSNRELIGVCLLTNLHATPDRVPVCVEALVHETIHQYLYRIELARGSFCDLADPGRYRSSWSGNRIPLHSLVHACFVWYGLLSAWCQFAKGSANAELRPKLRERVGATLFGFTYIRGVLEGPTFPRRSVEPRILELISTMADIASAVRRPGDDPRTLRESLVESECGGWVADLEQGLQQVRRSWRNGASGQQHVAP